MTEQALAPYGIAILETATEVLLLAVPYDRSVSHYGAAKLVPSTWRKSPYTDAMELDHLDVAAPYRRRGVATRLVREAFAWSERHGYPMTMVTAWTQNKGAIAFYESLGLHPHYVTFDTFWRPA